MIGFNFIYCRPDTEGEAVDLYTQFINEGKTPLYYGGGSEIITMCTAGSIEPDAVIDLKAIPGLGIMQETEGVITFGACKTLEDIRTGGLFPLLGQTGGRIADHTNQCRITLGGNLCGTIIYRETVLPLLLADAKLELFGPEGGRTVSIHEVFNERIQLLPGEFIASAQVDAEKARMPHAHIKRTFSEKTAYPAITAAALHVDGEIRIAFSGVCDHPFRNRKIEGAINDRTRSPKTRAEAAASLLPKAPTTDCEGSGAYRLELLKIVVEDIIGIFE